MIVTGRCCMEPRPFVAKSLSYASSLVAVSIGREVRFWTTPADLSLERPSASVGYEDRRGLCLDLLVSKGSRPAARWRAELPLAS